jgi:hypothetical protein
MIPIITAVAAIVKRNATEHDNGGKVDAGDVDDDVVVVSFLLN